MAYRMALVGYGFMGKRHVNDIVSKIPEIEVAGIYDIREEAMNEAKEKGHPLYATLEELLDDKTVDIAVIAIPNNFHKDVSIALLESGKNVICEKPVTLNIFDLFEIQKAADAAGKFFTVHQNRRWDRDYIMIKKILADNTIGKPYFIESRVQGSRRNLHGWRSYRENGGGMIYDWGVHLIDQLMMMIDSKVVSVYADLFHVFSQEVDDNFKIMLKFENGVLAMAEIATNCFILQPRWHVSCTEGTAVIKSWELDGEIAKLSSPEQMQWGDDIVYTAAGPTRTMVPRPEHTISRLPLPEANTCWQDYYYNIIGVLEGREELAVKPEECIRVLKVIDLCFASSRSGQSIPCMI